MAHLQPAKSQFFQFCSRLPFGLQWPPRNPAIYVPPPTSTVVEQGVAIRREIFLVSAPAPAPNPAVSSGGQTPAQFNFVRVVRYRVDTGDAPPETSAGDFAVDAGFSRRCR